MERNDRYPEDRQPSSGHTPEPSNGELLAPETRPVPTRGSLEEYAETARVMGCRNLTNADIERLIRQRLLWEE